MGRHARDLSIEDAPFNLTIPVSAETCSDYAVTSDPNNCVLANQVAIICGPGTEVSFGAAIALVRLPGDTITRRYILASETAAMVRQFDETGVFEPGDMELLAPTGTRRLGYHPPNPPFQSAPGSRAGGRFGHALRRPPTRHMVRPTAPNILNTR